MRQSKSSRRGELSGEAVTFVLVLEELLAGRTSEKGARAFQAKDYSCKVRDIEGMA